MKRVRTQADKDRNAMRKRAARHEDSTKKVDLPEAVRDQVSAARDMLGYPDQKTVISDGVSLLCNYKAEKATMEQKDEAKQNYIGTKENVLTLLEGSPCRECCSPLMIKSTSNLGTSLSVVYTCEKGHEKEWNSSKPNKERTHCEVDFDLCAASIMAKSTAAKLRDTLAIAGFKSMSSTVFNAAQNKLNEVAEKYYKLDRELTVAKIKLAYKWMAPEFEIDTAYHTRINSRGRPSRQPSAQEQSWLQKHHWR